MDLYPAVDLLEGGAVRLVQGDFGKVRRYGDPVELARTYERGGARWIHMVDLHAARRGVPADRDAIVAVRRAVGTRLQVGGGIRSAEDAGALLALGVDRVVLGTAAVESPDLVRALVERHPGRVAVGLDHRGSELAVRGWERSAGTSLQAVLDDLASVEVAALVVTAIDRDGMLGGPDVEGLGAVLAASAHPVVASGGVRSVADLEALASLGRAGRRLAGAVVGTALVEGTLSVEEAIAACVPSG